MITINPVRLDPGLAGRQSGRDAKQKALSMSILSRLFGGGATPEPEPETYNGFRIYPEPVKEAGGYRVTARIEREIDGETKSHLMIRADTYQSLDAATEATLVKARQVIDQLGMSIFA